MKYIYYKTDGTSEIIESVDPLKLEKLQELVGGDIEFAPEEPDGSYYCVNEEGLLNHLPENQFARYRNQSVKGGFRGNVIHGKMECTKTDDGDEFVGFSDDEVEKFMRTKLEINKKLFEKDKVFTFIGIGSFMAQTTRTELKSLGFEHGGRPAFKDNKKGARKKFTVDTVKDDLLIFEGTDLPFIVDGEQVSESSNGFTSRVIRGNALINLIGKPEEIIEYVKNKNLNPFFDAYDRINLVGKGDIETLLFPDLPPSCRMVADRQQRQRERAIKNG